MEYRKLPHGDIKESFSVLGLGMGGIHVSNEKQIEETIHFALENGVNFFDVCAGNKKTFLPFGRAISQNRNNVFLQMHFGAVYNKNGAYAWSRSLKEIKETFTYVLDALNTTYADFGFLHCIDSNDDFNELVANGILDYIMQKKQEGTVRHIGFSSHTPSVANRILDNVSCDMMMFSINPAYDFEIGVVDTNGIRRERSELFMRAQKEGIGISVMKPFHAGKLLKASTSTFPAALSKYQCLQYALDRPGVVSCVPGIRGLSDLKELIGFTQASNEEKDYSIIGTFTPEKIHGSCVYCNHCQPCSEGIDIGLVNKYYDLALTGDKMAIGHYHKLSIKAGACTNCLHCDFRCPFDVKQSQRMKEIDDFFKVE